MSQSQSQPQSLDQSSKNPKRCTGKIYLDANATAPLTATVSLALQELLEETQLANPSSIHSHGQLSKRKIAQARDWIASSLKADPEALMFTSSGSEANQTILRSLWKQAFQKHKAPLWVLSPVEHESVFVLVEQFQSLGGKIIWMDVDSSGVPQFDQTLKRLSLTELQEIGLMSLIWVHNESGVITPLEPFEDFCELRKIPLHVDAVQAWGKLPIDLSRTKAHWLSFSGHKIGALGGVGLVWRRPGQIGSPLILGSQEKGLRGGTENLFGIYSMGCASKALSFNHKDQELLRDQMEQVILGQSPKIQIIGAGAQRVGQTSFWWCEGIDARSLVIALDLEGISVSSGPACSSGVSSPSRLLMALGKSKEQAQQGLRISLHAKSQKEDIEGFLTAFQKVYARMSQRKGIS